MPFGTIAQQKFVCDGFAYISVVESGQTDFFELSTSEVGLMQRSISVDFDASINAIGYNPKDSLIYGLDAEINRLFRLWADGTVEPLQYIPLSGDFFAGDIHPSNGKLFLLNSDSLAIIDLEVMETPVQYIPLRTMDSIGVLTTDIAFHPITRVLYGYDGVQGKLITINESTGLVDNVSFPGINFNDGMPALFFDPRGSLFGIGNNNATQSSILFNFDINTGLATRSNFEGAIGDRDGCSCPYTLKLFQKINNALLTPCASMELVLTISNLTSSVQTGYDLYEVFPDGYNIEEVLYNPYESNSPLSVGGNEFQLTDMQIPIGVDSIKLLISIPEDADGEIHSIQAELTGINQNTDESQTLLSNDLLETINNSPSTFEVQNVNNLFSTLIPEVIELCLRDTFVLELPPSDDFNYNWNDGFEGRRRVFFENEEVVLNVSNACASAYFPISIMETDFSINLGEDLFLGNGEITILSPEINSISPIDSFTWRTVDGDIPCNNCPALEIQVLNDTKYILIAKNESGCLASDEINIFTNRKLYAPNVFSPNGDGFNDTFFFSSSFPGIDIVNFRIYNRWGGVVFESVEFTSNQSQLGWDGTFNGKNVPTGSYFWSAQIKYNDSRFEQIKGSVVLTR